LYAVKQAVDLIDSLTKPSLHYRLLSRPEVNQQFTQMEEDDNVFVPIGIKVVDIEVKEDSYQMDANICFMMADLSKKQSIEDIFEKFNKN
jgi:hypothetical protein